MSAPCSPRVPDDVVRVARAREDGATLAQIAEDFGIHEMTLSKWMRQADVEDGDRPGATRAESAENRELKRIRLLEQEDEVLRRVAAVAMDSHTIGSPSWILGRSVR